MGKNNVVRMDNPKVAIIESKKVIVETKIVLPEISRSELIERYKRIRPIVKSGSFLYTLKDFSIEDLLLLSFINNIDDIRNNIISPRELLVMGDFACYHKIGDNGEFKPKIGEILSQFPDEYLKEANLFYLKDYPKTLEDFENQSELIKAGCHKSRVRALRIEKK